METITGVTFEDATYDYDGEEKTLSVTGTLPEGVTVSYSSNKGTNAGTYNATATLSGEGYNTLTLTAKLVINKINITGVTFEGATYSFDGEEKTLSVTGSLPEGVTVSYSSNKGTNAGTYNATATLSGTNYNTLTLTAKLIINKIALPSVEFKSESFEYDTFLHSISVTGAIPSDAKVTYTGGEDGKNGATNPGKYTVTVTITHPNYNTITLEATITIKSPEENLVVFVFNGAVYFQNSLDKDRLYMYDGVELVKVNNDKLVDAVVGNSEVYYISKGLLSTSISAMDANNKDSTLLDVSAKDLIFDGTNIYYSAAPLFNKDETGIFRVSLADLKDSSKDVTPTRVTSVKAEWLNIVDGVIYFSNKDDGSKLYAVSASATNATPTKLYDYKVGEMINDGEALYFTRSTFPTAAIYSINVEGGYTTAVTDESDRVVKITTSNGKNLTVVDDYVYFINTDMLTSTIFGDGIYRAKKDGSTWVSDVASLLLGSKVIAPENDQVFALTTDGYCLYYYRTSTRHLYEYDPNTEEETDLMAGFVPPEDTTPILTYYEKAQAVGDDIYFINMKDGGRLYKYNVKTGNEFRITGLQVADFAVHDGYIYYATVRLLVNFDLYRMNVIYGEPERLSTEKCMNFSFYGDKLYYTSYSGSNTFNRMNLDGTNVEVLFDEKSVSAGETTLYGGAIYFVANDQLYKYDLATSTASLVNKDLKPLEYIIHDGKILMMNCAGLKNSVTLYDIATDTITKLDDLGFSGISDDIRGLFVYNNEMYYYRNVAAGSSKKGLYKVVKNGNAYEAQLVNTMEGYYLAESMVIGNKLYFLDVWQVKDSVPTPSSTAKLYVLDLSTLTAANADVTPLN
ncbi:MAG: DUF5050 domain-containing protein [Clostridia bacterium]|nr:DUF5050 domain-containing protein [Clostridia bacterium]